jgi:hypothetical protein
MWAPAHIAVAHHLQLAMAGKEEGRQITVSGLPWQTDERKVEVSLPPLW